MRIRLRRRRGVTLRERRVAAGGSNPREHDLSRELEEPLA
jgi:hypothetical protein